jgi:hypothetical protein
MAMQMVIQPNGTVRCVYGEDIELAALGDVRIARGSHVEPATDGGWTADLSPVNGPVLGPFRQRSAVLKAELCWLNEHWL